jgi:cobalt/nickel transport system permease protein
MSGLHLHSGVAGNTHSPIHRLDPRAKLIGLASITFVAVSTPLGAWPVFVACALALATVAALARVSPRTLWSRAKVVLPLVLFVAVFVPFFRGGEQLDLGPVDVSKEGLATFATVSAKAILGTLSAVLLGATTTFPAVLRALEAMRVPRLLVLVAAFMYRYLFVIVAEVGRMRAALAARAYRPRHLLHAAALGRMSTALFLRTYARGERVYLAMLSRGYRGGTPHLTPLRFRQADAVFVAGVLALLVAVRAGVEVAA